MQRAAVLLALLLLTVVPPAHAGTEAEAQQILTDAANDLAVAGTLTAPVPRGSMDLRYLELEETEDAILFTLGTQPNTGHADQGQAFIHFRHEDAKFRLNLQQRNGVMGWYWVYVLHRVEPSTGGLSFVSASRVSEPLAASGTEGWVQAEIARSDLADRSGALPFAGRALEDVWVESAGWTVDPQLRDRMPDSGTAREPFVLSLGPQQRGDVELWSPSPGRASNGEATTLIYEVMARNKGGDALRLRFGAEDAPDGWEVTFPRPVVALEAGETASFPVLVRTPFQHGHGSVDRVNVTLTGVEDAGDQGRTTLSVLYHAVPQPAGHHDTLWFHSDASPDALSPIIHASGLYVWHSLSMNAQEEFDADDEVPVPAQNADGYQYWGLFLDPVLQMGLDFDLARLGTVEVTLRADTPIPAASISGTLLVQWQEANGGWDSLVVANVEATEPRDLDRDEEATFQAVVRPTPDSDLVPYREGANLALYLRMDRGGDWVGTGPEKPELLPGGSMRLPLNEYHDAVDDVFESLQGVSLKAAGPQQRPVNPGETVTFRAELGFDGPARDFRLFVEGQDAGLARVVGADRVTVGDGQRASVTVAVQAPDDAEHARFLDLVLVARQADDSDVQAILRIVAEVDAEADHADEGLAVTGAGKDSPGPGLLPLAVALGAIVVALRRRS